MVVGEDEDEEEDEAEEVEVPVEEARVLGEDGEDLEEDELEEVAGEGEDEAEEDLHQHPPLLVLLVQPPVQEPQPRPAQPHQRRAHHRALVEHRAPPHRSPRTPRAPPASRCGAGCRDGGRRRGGSVGVGSRGNEGRRPLDSAGGVSPTGNPCRGDALAIRGPGWILSLMASS